MADYASGLPIRSEADGTDERVHVKVVDGVTPSQRMSVDSDLNAHVEVHGNNPANGDEVLRLSEIGAITPDGVYHATNNTKPGNVGIIASSRSATPGDTTQTIRLTGVQGSTSTTVWALDIALRDENAEPFSASNPLPVFNVGSEGNEINDYNKGTAIAAGATSNHDYTTLAAMALSQIWASASGKLKIEVQVETAAASGIFNTFFVGFNSTATPNITVPVIENKAVANGAIVRVIRTNLDNQAQDLYSTISGHDA